MEIDLISAAEANAILTGQHYLGAKARFAHICFATPERDAVAIYAPPVAASINRNIFELARLWQSDNEQRPVSQFLAANAADAEANRPALPWRDLLCRSRTEPYWWRLRR